MKTIIKQFGIKRILLLYSLVLSCNIIAQEPIRLWEGTDVHAQKVIMTPYLASPETNTGTAVVVFPGGSYSWLDKTNEGVKVGQWLQNNGINAFVVHYRVASIAAYCLGYRVWGLGNKYPDMVDDAARALEYVYTHAEEWKIDTTKVGTMGFSAGGHLSLSAYVYNQTPYKPKFICMAYPVVTLSNKEYTHKRSRRGALGVWRQWNKEMQDSLSLEKHVPADCPPVFLFNCINDPIVDYQNSELLDAAFTNAGVKHTYIQYQTGEHGFGASEEKGTAEARAWKQSFLRWLETL